MGIPTDDQVIDAFRAYLWERETAGVSAAQAVADVQVHDRTVTVVFDLAVAGFDRAALVDSLPFENWGDFVGLPIAFDNPNSNHLRSAVDKVTARLSDGTEMGSRSAAELFKAATGREPGAEGN